MIQIRFWHQNSNLSIVINSFDFPTIPVLRQLSGAPDRSWILDPDSGSPCIDWRWRHVLGCCHVSVAAAAVLMQNLLKTNKHEVFKNPMQYTLCIVIRCACPLYKRRPFEQYKNFYDDIFVVEIKVLLYWTLPNGGRQILCFCPTTAKIQAV